jgi:hypothetical protein
MSVRGQQRGLGGGIMRPSGRERQEEGEGQCKRGMHDLSTTYVLWSWEVTESKGK